MLSECEGGGLNQTSVLKLVLFVLKLRECASIINYTDKGWNEI